MEQSRGWKLRDVIMMAILGVVFAAVYLGVFYVGLAIQGALAPFGLANFSFETIYGVWFMAATIAAYILRKPGAALITELLAAAIELLMGNSGGVVVLLTGLIQGLGCELAFALFRYRRYDLLSMALSGMLGGLFIFCYELYYLQYYLLAPTVLLAQLAVRFVSAFVFAGLLSKLACDGLAKTGVLKSYAVGALQQADLLADED
ncbi:ECF transporter S component [Neobittarella massiliensis]|uniref:ECF transporter S component n=2 Tax=Oscillospiraceae TaxID=216572 RepID=A0A8J6IQU8_9FIRM|nr:ECF transporter S component [Neobittarella massiliensis]MBC3517375.1 ECF transporter S component [Neobittarella massiliensis]SCJ91234.1 Putative HMP/thiamine permease protein ykoE [uncultured Anaerotruncus sp.]